MTADCFLGDLTVGPNSTLVFSVNGDGSGVLIVMGCLTLSNGSQVAVSLDGEPGAGQYDVANAACYRGTPQTEVKVRMTHNTLTQTNLYTLITHYTAHTQY